MLVSAMSGPIFTLRPAGATVVHAQPWRAGTKESGFLHSAWPRIMPGWYTAGPGTKRRLCRRRRRDSLGTFAAAVGSFSVLKQGMCISSVILQNNIKIKLIFKLAFE